MRDLTILNGLPRYALTVTVEYILESTGSPITSLLPKKSDRLNGWGFFFLRRADEECRGENYRKFSK
jgi:hypothetical protein